MIVVYKLPTQHGVTRTVTRVSSYKLCCVDLEFPVERITVTLSSWTTICARVGDPRTDFFLGSNLYPDWSTDWLGLPKEDSAINGLSLKPTP